MLFKKLWQLHILSPGGLMRWAVCFVHEGFTLMALMRFAAHYYPDRTALVDGRDRFSYRELYEQSTNLSKELAAKHGLRSGMGVSMYCPNTAQSVIHLFALSRLGLKIKLMELDSAPDIDRRRVKMFFRSSNSSSLQFFKSSILQFFNSSILQFFNFPQFLHHHIHRRHFGQPPRGNTADIGLSVPASALCTAAGSRHRLLRQRVYAPAALSWVRTCYDYRRIPYGKEGVHHVALRFRRGTRHHTPGAG